LNLIKKLYPEFYWEFEVDPIEKIVQNIQILHHAKIEYFWSTRRMDFVIYNLEPV
jgi:hypothetical protein